MIRILSIVTYGGSFLGYINEASNTASQEHNKRDHSGNAPCLERTVQNKCSRENIHVYDSRKPNRKKQIGKVGIKVKTENKRNHKCNDQHADLDRRLFHINDHQGIYET